MIYGAEYATWATEPESIEVESPELPGCPVMIANGLYDVDQKWPDVAMRMLKDHLTDETRTCCDEHGFAIVDLEAGCTSAEIGVDPYRLQPAMQGALFAELEPKPAKVSTAIYSKEVA